MDKRKRIGWAMVGVGCLVGLVFLWQWALLGMSPPVQAAAASTGGGIAAVGLMLATAP